MYNIRILDRTGSGIAVGGIFIPANKMRVFEAVKLQKYMEQVQGLVAKGAIEAHMQEPSGAWVVMSKFIAEDVLTDPDTFRIGHQSVYMNLQANATLVHQLGASGGGYVNAAAFSGVQPIHLRAVQCTHTGAATTDPYTITVHGTNFAGHAVTEDIVVTAAGTFPGYTAFAYISRLSQTGTIELGDTCDIELSSIIGFPHPIAPDYGALYAYYNGTYFAVADIDTYPENNSFSLDSTTFSLNDDVQIVAVPDWSQIH